MAFYDNTLLLSNAQSIGSATNVASTTTYDVTGAGVGSAPSMVWGTSANLAADVMVGRPMYLYLTVTTAFSAGASTFTVAVQAAPPSATGNNAGTWTTLYQSAAFTGTNLTAGSQLVAPIPPFALIQKAETLPRFYRFFYTTSTATFSAGTFSAGIILDTPTGMVSTLYPNNFASGL